MYYTIKQQQYPYLLKFVIDLILFWCRYLNIIEIVKIGYLRNCLNYVTLNELLSYIISYIAQ